MQGISLLWLSLAAAVVLLVPGGALQAWLTFDSQPASARRMGSALSTLADSVALSISLSSLLAVAVFYAGAEGLPTTVISALYGVCLAVLAAALARAWRITPERAGFARTAGWWLLAVLFFAALAAWRLYQARSLVLPAWVDSVHHTLIVRMITEQGGLPQDFSPFLPVPFFYHFGFHVITALFAGWSGFSADQAVLWFGQLLNAAVALSVYRLGSALYSRGKTDGQQGAMTEKILSATPLIAALLVGFVFQMPAYYLTWGRYTMLTGLLLAGPTAAAALEAWDDPARLAPWVRLTLLVAGLVLAHYFILLVVALFLMLIGGASLRKILRGQPGWAFFWRLAVFAGLGLLITAPWAWRVWTYNQQSAAVQFVSFTESDTAWKSALDYLRYLTYVIGPRRNHILLALAGVGLLAALRHPWLRILAAWGVLMALMALPWGPRVNPFRPDHFAIVLFFPASLLLAGLMTEGAAAAARVARPWIGIILLSLAVGGLLIWGARDTRRIINTVTVIGNPADVAALDWVIANTPADARFYINTVKWQGKTYRGVDGGYWLMPYAGRASLIPPVFYAWGPREYVQQITRISETAAAIKDCTPEFWDLVRESQLTHVYARQGRGSLQPEVLSRCANLREIYHADGVFLYEITP